MALTIVTKRLTIELSLVVGVNLVTTSKKANKPMARAPQFYKKKLPGVLLSSLVCSNAIWTSPATLAFVDSLPELVTSAAPEPVKLETVTRLPMVIDKSSPTINQWFGKFQFKQLITNKIKE